MASASEGVTDSLGVLQVFRQPYLEAEDFQDQVRLFQ
jgi:hypothetical protein